MRLIVATALCVMAFIGASQSMPVAENTLAPSPQPSLSTMGTTEDGSLLVVPLEKDVQPKSVTAAVKKISSGSVQSQEHQARETSARSSESVAIIPEVDTKDASEIVNSAKSVNDAVARFDEASQSLPEEKSAVKISAESSVLHTEISGLQAEDTSSSLDFHGSLDASTKSSAEGPSELIDTIAPPVNEEKASAKFVPTESKGVQMAAIPKEESSEKQRRVAERVLAQSDGSNKVEGKEIKKEAEASLEKTDRVTREAEEAAAAAKASLAPSKPASAIPSSTVLAAELPLSVPALHLAGAPKIAASLTEIEKPEEAAVAAPKIGDQAESIDSPRADGSVEKEDSPKVDPQVKKEIEKKSVMSEESKPIDKLAVETAGGRAPSEKREIEDNGSSSSAVTIVPQAKSEIVELATAGATVKSIITDAAPPTALYNANSEHLEPAESANADSNVRAVKEVEKSSEEQVVASGSGNKEEDSSSTIAAKSSLFSDTVEKTTKSVTPEDVKAEELPKPQEVTATKESSEKRNATSKESSESSESSESEEASSGKHVEHSE